MKTDSTTATATSRFASLLPALTVCGLLVAIAAYTGARFAPGAWYAGLDKPAWTPPNWVFPVAWTLLYVAIAIAGALAWRADPRRFSPLMLAWGMQLVLNAAWSWLFFSLHRPWLALVDIALLLLTILAFMRLTWTASRAAALLFLPYALWVGYAAALNLRIAQLN